MLWAIFSLGLFLRTIGSLSVYFAFDERQWLSIADKISFSPSTFNLVMHGDHHPFLEVYIIKLSTLIFNKHFLMFLPEYIAERVSYRSLQVLLCSSTIVIVYLLAHSALSKSAALFSSFLLSVSQFHIHLSRTIVQIGPLLFFASLSLLFFWKSLKDKKYILFTGASIGLAYLCEESAFFLLAICLIYLLITGRLLRWLHQWETYAAIVLFLIFISPDLYWNLVNQGSSIFLHLNKAAQFHGISLLSLSLYLGELFIWFVSDIIGLVGGMGKGHVWPFAYPTMHWVLGVICLLGVVTAFRERRDEFIKLMLTVFCFIFLFFTFCASLGPFGNFSFYWASLSTIPALILAGNLFAKMWEGKWQIRCIPVAASVYLLGSAVAFLSIHDNTYIRRPEFLGKFYTNLAHDAILMGDYKSAAGNLEKAMKYAPGSAYVRSNLVECYKHLGDYTQRAEVVEKDADWINPKYLFDRGYLKKWQLADSEVTGKLERNGLGALSGSDFMEGSKHLRDVYGAAAVIDLKKIENPSTGKVTYAFTNIYSPRAQMVNLWVMVDDGATIWINGGKVFSQETGRRLWIGDQDRIAVNLKNGWNKVVVKVLYQGGAYYGYAIKVTDLNGEMIKGLIDGLGWR